MLGRGVAVALLLSQAMSAGADTNELKMQLKETKKLDITALFQAESDLHQVNDGDHQSDGRITLAPSYRFNKTYRATVSAALLQDFGAERRSAIANVKVTVAHSPFVLSEDTTLLSDAGARLPTNADDHRDNTFNGSLLVKNNLITAWNVKGVGFSTIYGLYALKNFHTYDRNNVGKANINYALSQYFGIETYVAKHLYITLDGDYTFANAYQNEPSRQFNVGQALTYEDKQWSLTIGHSNGGNALQANGTDYNVQVFDRNRSVLFAAMRVVY